MELTTEQISSAKTDDELFKLLGDELARLFPPWLLKDTETFLAGLRAAPRGLRAMAAIYELDVSMALDDLAWHFVNHHDQRFYEEARLGLRELEAHGAAILFEKAYAVIAPRWDELGRELDKPQGGDVHDWLDSTGIQKQVDPINHEMWQLINQNREFGLLSYWLSYSRKYPERCVGGESPTNGGNCSST